MTPVQRGAYFRGCRRITAHCMNFPGDGQAGGLMALNELKTLS